VVFFATGNELVGADGLGAGAFAEESGALAVEFTFEFRLPEAEFGLKLCVEGSEFGGLAVDELQAPAIWGGGIGDGGIQFLLLFHSETGDGGFRSLSILIDELGLERLIPIGAEVGDGFLELVDLDPDSILRFEIGKADFVDVGGAFFFNLDADGVTEEEEDERVGNGEAHENGDQEAEGELGELAVPGKEGTVSGEESSVDREDDEGPDGGDRVDRQGIIDEGGEGVGAGDESEGAGDEHGGTKGHVFALLPVRALFKSFGASSRKPEEGAFHGVHHS
jgi:hypothetical protein